MSRLTAGDEPSPPHHITARCMWALHSRAACTSSHPHATPAPFTHRTHAVPPPPPLPLLVPRVCTEFFRQLFTASDPPFFETSGGRARAGEEGLEGTFLPCAANDHLFLYEMTGPLCPCPCPYRRCPVSHATKACSQLSTVVATAGLKGAGPHKQPLEK